MRRCILLFASGGMALQVILLLAMAQAPLGWPVLSAIAAMVATAVLAREALRMAPRTGIRPARRGGIEVLDPQGATLATEVLLASPLLVVLQVAGEGRGRVLTVWGDSLSAAEFRRFLATARWARQPAGSLI